MVEIAILKKEQGNPEVHLFDLYPKGIFDELLKEVSSLWHMSSLRWR